MNIPIIKLEVQHMRQTVHAMLSEYTLSLSEEIKQALDRACTDEAIAAEIDKTVRQCVNEAVKEEIQSFFRWSNPGREAIREAVQAHMNEYWGPRDAD